jgi:hypothetical protein
MAAQQMDRDELLALVRKLPDKTPIASTLFPTYSAKIEFINWLDHPLRARRNARSIYNRWWNAPLFIWLAEASGIDQDRIEKLQKLLLHHQEIQQLKPPQYDGYYHGT